MKAATGELNLTLITVIAIGAILGLFYLLWPQIRDRIVGEVKKTNEAEFELNMYTEDFKFVEFIETDLF